VVNSQPSNVNILNLSVLCNSAGLGNATGRIASGYVARRERPARFRESNMPVETYGPFSSMSSRSQVRPARRADGLNASLCPIVPDGFMMLVLGPYRSSDWWFVNCDLVSASAGIVVSQTTFLHWSHSGSDS
jgi:hypothetical protein